MKQKPFLWYYLCSVAGVLAASFYPLYGGVRVLADVLKGGTVPAENYPKYLIPYLPISLAVLVGVLLLPAALRLAGRFAMPAASGVSLGVFFLTEILLENVIIVTDTLHTALENWQMFSCYITPDFDRTTAQTALDILVGDYSPMFKVHFYLISVVLILSLLNCFYGFAHRIRTGETRRMKLLTVQAVVCAVFLGLCIFACFTAFYRTGTLDISPVSAVLMILFFVVLGVTAGVCAGSFLSGRPKWLSVWFPSAVSVVFTLFMYVGESILLGGKLFRFGNGFFFDRLGSLGLAPVDVAVILAAGGICAGILAYLSAAPKQPPETDKQP